MSLANREKQQRCSSVCEGGNRSRTFLFVLGEDGLVALQDVGDEEAAGLLGPSPATGATQVGPEGPRHGEVPRGGEAVLSWSSDDSNAFDVSPKRFTFDLVDKLIHIVW
jgi:hypothetical protein